MQNIDVTQETTAYLWANKKELETKLNQTAENKNIGFDPEYTWDIGNSKQGNKIGWSPGKRNLNKNANQHRRTDMSKEKNDVITLCYTILQRLAMHIFN